MSTAAVNVPADDSDPEIAFYRHVLQLLARADVPVLVGGAYALCAYTGIARRTKDLDLFLLRSDYDRAAQVLAAAGYPTELKFPHWLGKARADPWFVDLIFDSGNGLTRVDDAWFDHAVDAEVLGLRARIVPVEEMIWSKAFLMERERYDGADVAHLLRACAKRLDWRRLTTRMEPHWRVLLSHLVLFGFIYPAERTHVPQWVMDALLERLRHETDAPAPNVAVCQGTLLSREQYLHDVNDEGYRDARLSPPGTMSEDDIATWTRAIEEDRAPPRGSA
jgi:hypothetical protein